MRLTTKIARLGTIHDNDGRGTFLKAIIEGLQPDPSLPLDEWSDRYAVIPRSTGAAEYGKYRIDRTPHAKEIMRCLSNRHPCRRVVLMAASQMLKTQIALNWFCYVVHQHPSNFLWLMPTGKLHKRIVQRIDRVIDATDVIRNRVSPPGSRVATNSQDIKVFQGGTLYIATAGSAANLAEVPAKYVSFDEIDRAELSVDGEGDPVKLAEGRQTTFSSTAKSYYYSSPTIKDESRIESLYMDGTQRVALAECIHCGHAQELIFENLILDKDEALYPCIECGGLHRDSDKRKMFAGGLWSDAKSESKTESFLLSAMYQPYGWYSWSDLHKQYESAKIDLDRGDEEQMIVFYNTRLARSWEHKKEVTRHDVLMHRADDYRLGTVPAGGTILTAAIDTQADRLELKTVAWGMMMECWVVDYRIIIGDPSDLSTWKQALDVITSAYTHISGQKLKISTTFVDSGGLHTQEVYNFVMQNKYHKVFAIKGDSRPNRPIIPARPSNVDLNYKGKFLKKGVVLWHIGTDTAKDYLYARWKREKGYGAVHFSKDLPEDYFKQLVSEYRTSKFVRGIKKTIWEKKNSDRNEGLDLMVYNLAAAHKLGVHRLTESQWAKKEIKKAESEREESVTEEMQEMQEMDEFHPQQTRERKKIRFKTKGKFNPLSW